MEGIDSVKTSAPERGAVLEQEAPVSPSCRHHWIIERPTGPVSNGTCRTCGEVRAFQNYVESSLWCYDVSLEQLAGAATLRSGLDLAPSGDKAGLEDEP